MSHRYVIIHVLSSRTLTPLFSLAKVPPFSSQSAVQILSAAICVLFQDWLEAEKQSPGAYFPADRIDSAVEQYLRELATGDAQRVTREGYEGVRRELRRSW
jgi:nuclear pore complex protein Nup155